MMQSEGQERTQSQSERALFGIRELLFSGVFEPGARLSEPAIAERLQLSRTPVRAALARLEQEGAVDAIPSGGFAVRKFATDDILDAIELRGVLEGTAARLAAERGISPAQIMAFRTLLSEIDALLQATGNDLDHDAYTACNAAFHALVRESCGSSVIAREIDRLTALPFASPNALLMVQRDLPEFHGSLVLAQSQHRAIVNAIELREGSRAEALAREHARLARRNLEVAMNDDRIKARYPALTLVTA
ncbi:GntR family transcriptional regulator [uncultured Nisaea sp.]|uniref:GntR family transcriptional regulator n=1 Tax=uncultured Nisaea sp. TaxID=538215 RepID=UPI0030EF36DD|tara:strand:+ start:2674 stop:3417 length:744 start_codon:yes stop_codon:yes gene_type:complete